MKPAGFCHIIFGTQTDIGGTGRSERRPFGSVFDNRWANERVVDAISGLTQEQYVRDLGSSHSSVRDTLTHIVWAEWIWLRRRKGESPKVDFAASDLPEPAALRSRWLGIEREQRSFVELVTSEQLSSVVSYANVQGETWAYPLWQQICHLVNHSTYHRGQAATMLCQLGMSPAATDLLVFDGVAGPGPD